jgi:MFS family permease
VLVLTVASAEAPSAPLLALVLAIFGYGQGLVMAPLSSAVLSSVKPASAGSGAGMYGTTTQIANAAGVAAIGATFLRLKLLTRRNWRFLCRQRCLRCRLPPLPHFCHGCDSRRCEPLILGTDSTRSFYFAVQQLCILGGVTRFSPRSCRCPSLTMSNSCDA